MRNEWCDDGILTFEFYKVMKKYLDADVEQSPVVMK